MFDDLENERDGTTIRTGLAQLLRGSKKTGVVAIIDGGYVHKQTYMTDNISMSYLKNNCKDSRDIESHSC